MTTATASRRLDQRAQLLTVQTLGARTHRVSSGSGDTPHVVRGCPQEPVAGWTCDCRGASGRRHLCSHKRALAKAFGVPAGEPNDNYPLSLQAPGGRPDPAARPAGEIDHTTGDAMPPKADGELMTFRCTVPPIMSAVKVDGGPDGGVRLQIDVPGADEAAALAFVKACRGRELRLVVVDESKGA